MAKTETKADASLPHGVMLFKGKKYKTVALRIDEFRQKWPTYGIATSIYSVDEKSVLVRAVIRDDQGRIIATGLAEEFRTPTGVNQTSAVENCETSAIGRALAVMGLAGEEFASADELAFALTGQQTKAQVASFMRAKAAIAEAGMDKVRLGKAWQWAVSEEANLTNRQLTELRQLLEAQGVATDGQA